MKLASEIVKALREGRATSLVDGTAIVVMTEEEEAAIVAKMLEPVREEIRQARGFVLVDGMLALAYMNSVLALLSEES